ncbi:PREDICTED: E3 ubiquitin-protein ligase RNF123 [Trachymyrmex septentrionalis]|uniref:E3 ubiquitin-protein ligase RNF123 n=1 Tax=Trachymyrmex septentrionalis TaxID=34720 RepID=UPI00084F6B34|nr:PREDICTED: E3 ubiquitin-protein ligase RNF123 [Trachymyrmex septentrionalis]
MDADKVLYRIFGANPLDVERTAAGRSKDDHLGQSRSFQNLNWVNEHIRKSLLNLYIDMWNSEDNREGRIGPHFVRFDISIQHGLCIISPDRLSVNSQSSFSTIRANTGVFKGKWMYEVQLGSKGVMQVGWGTAQCKFNQQYGVGDTPNSYAYDGNRMRKWNVSTHKYGEAWLTGDIIGCALDMDDGTIDFYRNGRSLGRAFENIPMGAGIAYFPTVSLAFTENLTANFGSIPFRYPIEDYKSLQAPPMKQVRQAMLLFQWFSQVIELLEYSKNVDKQNILLDDKTMSAHAFLMCLARSILKHIGPLLTIPYVTETVFVPFIQMLCNLTTDDSATKSAYSNIHSTRSIVCLDLLWTFLEEHEIKMCLESTVLHLLSAFRHVSLLLEYPDQCKSLILLTKICQHTVTRQYFLQYLLFDRVRFANFVHVKPLDEGGLTNVVEKVWWETNPLDSSIEANKTSYLYACERIKAAISEVEALQVKLLVILLNNTDGTAKRPTSRAIFLKKFKRFVQENLISNRTPLPITLCCFHRLLVAFRILWDTEIGTSPVYIPCRAFYDASIDYSGIDRLGGVITHLNKTFRNELLRLLGSDHELIIAMEQQQHTTTATNEASNNAYAVTDTTIRQIVDLPVTVPAAIYPRLINITPPAASTSQGSSMILERFGFFSYRDRTREDRTPIRHGPTDPETSLMELLDNIILFYHVAAKKQLAKVAGLRDSMSAYINAIANTKSRLEYVKQETSPGKNFNAEAIQRELLRTTDIFNTKLSEQARHMAWIRAAVYSEEKQAQLAWLLKVITLTLQMASQQGNMFSFVPDFYLETLSDLSVSLRAHMHPTVPIENIPDYRTILCNAAEFLCDHFLDPRIVHANSKDVLILALAGFVSNPLMLEALENVPRKSRIKIVTNLLKPYENRAWAQSNWVLLRFWQGNGFAFRYEKSPHLSKIGMKQQESVYQLIKPCPSVIYQAHVRDVLLGNPQASTQFLNSLLNQLNWAFSEFIGMVQEIHNVSSRPERVFIESRQLKICATCFDLAISLLRVLEMICTVAWDVFSDPKQSSSEILLARLCQLLCQVLNRMSSQTNCFQHVMLLEIPDLESVDHFPILAAVIGILLALLKKEMKDFGAKSTIEIPRITRSLLTEPSFQITSLRFVLSDTKLKNTKTKNIKPFSLLNYQEDVTADEINRVKQMITYLDTCHTLLPDTKLISDDDNACTICYAFPITVIFRPCNHQTCRICIDRHLLNTRECFFCKTIIDKVEDLSGNTLHDFTSEFSISRTTS